MRNIVSRTGQANALPSQRRLQSLFRYDKRTGSLYWRERVNPAVVLGVPIGAKQHAKGLRAMVRIDGTLFYVSRVIWKLVTGVDPGSKEVDHKDTDVTNDRWRNLQLLTRKQNLDKRDPDLLYEAKSRQSYGVWLERRAKREANAGRC